jgi:hypothetical protein
MGSPAACPWLQRTGRAVAAQAVEAVAGGWVASAGEVAVAVEVGEERAVVVRVAGDLVRVGEERAVVVMVAMAAGYT